ncbi:MAG: GumC family protein [Phormidesmis sp.]
MEISRPTPSFTSPPQPVHKPIDRPNNKTGPTPIPPAPMLAAWQQQEPMEDDGDLRNLISMVRRRAWAVAGVAVAVMSFMTVQTLQQEKVFQGQFRVLVEPVNADDDFSELTSVLAEQQLNNSGLDYETQIQVLRSPELIEPIADKLDDTYPEISYAELLENLSITRVGETKILQVSYTHPDPVQIQVVLDQLSSSYLEYSLKERQTNLRQGINFVEAQLPDLQAQVNTLQDQLEAFRRQYDFITPEMQSEALSGVSDALVTKRSELTGDLSEAQQRFDSLQSEDGAIAALDGAPVYQQLLGELRSVETEIAKELTRFEPDSLAIQVLEEQRANMLPLLQQEAQRVVDTKQAIAINQLQVLTVQNEALAAEEQRADQVQAELPSLIRQYTDLQRELEVAVEALSRFRLTRETLEIEAAQTEIPWQLIEAPMQPSQPISPNLQRSLILALVASVLLGLGAALLLEKLDNVYHSVDELKAGTKLPLLGTLPLNAALQEGRLLDDPQSRQQAQKRSVFAAAGARLKRLIPGKRAGSGGYYGYGGNSESSFIEALRVLHTNIRMLSSDRTIHSILVSSALPGEGKSTVAANLAKVATAMGQRVLIVDVDLRKPQVHKRLELDNQLGLSNLIADSLPLKSVLQSVGVDNQLFALTAGKIPPDPTKLLSSRKMRSLMKMFESNFDLVIYDAPPITGLADVSLIGQYTDGVVLVSRIGKTDRDVLTQTLETLRLAQVSILGLIANGVKSSALGGYRYYAYGYGAGNSEMDDESDLNELTMVSFADSREGDSREGSNVSF